MNILVIAPHPDDEVLGVGGTMARHASRGDRVFVCVVTRCYQPREGEDLPSYSVRILTTASPGPARGMSTWRTA